MEAQNSITIPFTYCINCPDGNRYYGVRYAKGCNPESLWITYFTSSKIIKKMLKTFSTDDFTFEIRKIFDNKNDAINHEKRVLRRIVGKPGWLNKSIGDKNFCNTGHSEETKRKLSIAGKGKKQSAETITKRAKKNTGKKRSEQFKQQMSELHTGRVVSEKTRKLQSEKRTGEKRSEESKARMREAQKGRTNSYLIGTKRSEETKAKMREAWIRRKTV